jgi:hypothetical protein
MKPPAASATIRALGLKRIERTPNSGFEKEKFIDEITTAMTMRVRVRLRNSSNLFLNDPFSYSIKIRGRA